MLTSWQVKEAIVKQGQGVDAGQIVQGFEVQIGTVAWYPEIPLEPGLRPKDGESVEAR